MFAAGLHSAAMPATGLSSTAGAGCDTAGLLHQLVVLGAFCKELELQAHLVHLNYSGSNFLSIHTFLKSQYEQHLGEFDALAEFVRIYGGTLPASNAQLRATLPSFCDCESSSPAEMVEAYIKNLMLQGEMARNLDATAAAARAIDVVDYAAQLAASAGKAIWFLSASR